MHWERGADDMSLIMPCDQWAIRDTTIPENIARSVLRRRAERGGFTDASLSPAAPAGPSRCHSGLPRREMCSPFVILAGGGLRPITQISQELPDSIVLPPRECMHFSVPPAPYSYGCALTRLSAYPQGRLATGGKFGFGQHRHGKIYFHDSAFFSDSRLGLLHGLVGLGIGSPDLMRRSRSSLAFCRRCFSSGVMYLIENGQSGRFHPSSRRHLLWRSLWFRAQILFFTDPLRAD